MNTLLKNTNPPPFNTLAQLTHECDNPEENLLKKAKRKAITVFLSGKLIELNNENLQAYRNMYYCNAVLEQSGQELKSSYCKNRFCLVCNSIKTANLINGYLPELKKMQSPQFMTLTIKAVKANKLKSAINQMQRDFRRINQTLTKYHKIHIQAIRKLECNYNPEKETFNPHYHLVIDIKKNAEIVRNMWLKLNPRSNLKGQDIRPADHNSMIELFKYASKTVGKNGILNPGALDTIYSAFKRKRIIQPIGIRKEVNEDKREKITYPNLMPDNAVWKWQEDNFDWVNEQTGECLTGYTPKNGIKSLFEILRE